MVTWRRQRQTIQRRWNAGDLKATNGSAGCVTKSKIWHSLEIFLMAVFCSFSADSPSEQVLATTESDMPADSEPLLVEVKIITIMMRTM